MAGRRLVALLLALALLAGCAGSAATATRAVTPTQSGVTGETVDSGGIMEKLDLETLTARADTIVVGTVLQFASRWLSDQSQIVTDVTFTVDEAVAPKSLGKDVIVVVVPGGTVGAVAQVSEDAPQFEVGQRALLFLTEAGGGAYALVGDAQGAQAIEGELVQNWEQSLADALNEIRQLKS